MLFLDPAEMAVVMPDWTAAGSAKCCAEPALSGPGRFAAGTERNPRPRQSPDEVK